MALNKSPGEKCEIDLDCQFGCCVNKLCMAKCTCPNPYWNKENGCNQKEGWTILSNIVDMSFGTDREPEALCVNDTNCKYGCCDQGKCQKCGECKTNSYWDDKNKGKCPNSQ